MFSLYENVEIDGEKKQGKMELKGIKLNVVV